MEDYLNPKGVCNVCREELTTIHAEVAPGFHVYVCEKCLESAKENFIWVCVHCGSTFIRPKELVLKRLKDPKLKKAFHDCADMQIIQGIERCIECSPDEVMELVTTQKGEKQGGHC